MLRRRKDRFLKHFARGAVIAMKDRDGAGAAGRLLDADDRGIYVDMADGGTTFFAWPMVQHLWDGPPAQRAIEHRDAIRADPEAAMRKAVRGIFGDSDEEPAPAFSEAELDEMLRERENARIRSVT